MTVGQCLAQHGYNVVTNASHLLEKIKKTDRKMFSQTNYMEQDSTKNYLTLAKTNQISKYTLSLRK